jgi:hypothetical protein
MKELIDAMVDEGSHVGWGEGSLIEIIFCSF